MNKIAHSVVVFLIFKIHWKKLLPIVVFITITFALFQLKTLPYQLTTPNSFHPDTNHFDINLKSQITPLTINEESEVIKIDPETDITTFSSQLVPSIAVVQEKVKVTKMRNQVDINKLVPSTEVVQEKVKVTETRNQVDINKPNKSVLPLSFSSASERRRKRYLRDIKGLSPYEALVYAKKELDTISVGVDYHDPDLYVPLFRNITVFERSYELMELILKVFVYQDGKRPIFHNPYLRGIYASEGWFMKFMESSKLFVTRDPQKAHLFYLPYSARQLQRALYVPNSHNIKPLSIFLRDYVNKIALKYPFWNRTHGSDHFLVACHDWGPYTLKDHAELTKNTIKALCNADTSEGVFVAGKDVSLPETTIGNPRRPLRNMGGKKISQRPLLAFFAGGMHGRVRPTLLKYWANKDKNMIISGPMSYKTMSYSRHMKSSKYCICPMGFEVNSPRIVEAIYYECVPVIIADNFVPPLNEVLNWSAFSVSVAEQDIPKLKEILEAIPMKRYRMMQTNVKMLQRHFYWNRTPVKYDMFHMILHSIWLSRLNQIQDLTGTL